MEHDFPALKTRINLELKKMKMLKYIKLDYVSCVEMPDYV